ncbi:MAG: NAD(P)H-hydrate epimerase [Actinomycetota bacterium]
MASSGVPEGQGFPVVPASTIPALTAEQMREIDRIMVEELHIDLIQMMENAGRALASLALRRFAPRVVTILAGPGGNGGGGLVAGRHLANHGVDVSVVLSSSDRMGEVPSHQLDVVERMGIVVTEEPPASALVIDAILGYSLRGDPRGRAADLIRWSLDQPAPVCSLDTPSGLDVTTGEPRTPCVRATATLTLALPKVGLAMASSYVGELYLADISVPPSVYGRLGLRVPDDLFARDSILRLS